MKTILNFLRDCVNSFGEAFELEAWEEAIKEFENRG